MTRRRALARHQGIVHLHYCDRLRLDRQYSPRRRAGSRRCKPGGIMQRTARVWALLTACGFGCAFGLQACMTPMGTPSHSPFEAVHDDALTYDDFDDVMDWDAPDGDPIADGASQS